jgi:hypothetical protein
VFAKDEEYFRAVLSGQWAAWMNSPVAKAVWTRKVRASFRPGWDGLRRRLAANTREIYLPSSEGFVRTGVLEADSVRINRVLEKIVRALFYHLTRRAMPQRTRMDFFWQPRDWLRDIALRARLVNIDPEVFSCRYAIATEGSVEISMWWMLFYQSSMVIVAAEACIEPDEVEDLCSAVS